MQRQYSSVKKNSLNDKVQPIFVSAIQMGEGEDDPLIGEQRANKVNNIIMNLYKSLMEKGDQIQLDNTPLTNIVIKYSNRVYNVIDTGFLFYRNLSFILDTAGMKKDNLYSLFEIQHGVPLVEDLVFIGVDNETPSRFLNNYGFFSFTTDDTGKMQLSFYAIDDVPATNWGVYIGFLYRL